MSKPIRSYPKSEQPQVIARRKEGKDRGLGYWAAVDATTPKQPKKVNK